jgi:hypothetical protein
MALIPSNQRYSIISCDRWIALHPKSRHFFSQDISQSSLSPAVGFRKEKPEDLLSSHSSPATLCDDQKPSVCYQVLRFSLANSYQSAKNKTGSLQCQACKEDTVNSMQLHIHMSLMFEDYEVQAGVFINFIIRHDRKLKEAGGAVLAGSRGWLAAREAEAAKGGRSVSLKCWFGCNLRYIKIY